LKIIFSNLISNAIKYQDLGKPESYLLITVSVTPSHVRLSFTDNGVGIDQAYQEQIFDMFVRASEQSEGSGLGLYIVKQAVSVMQGSLQLESKLGTGTTFTIYFKQ
jgi:signal transduction histidine kinase